MAHIQLNKLIHGPAIFREGPKIKPNRPIYTINFDPFPSPPLPDRRLSASISAVPRLRLAAAHALAAPFHPPSHPSQYGTFLPPRPPFPILLRTRIRPRLPPLAGKDPIFPSAGHGGSDDRICSGDVVFCLS